MGKELLVTKLHRPEPPKGWIERGVPFARLEESSRVPLTLVSAPAGYGKSVTVAAWLASGAEPSAWLSLDPGESEPADFLSYLLAAVRTLFPEACPETETLLACSRAAAGLGARAEPRQRAGPDRAALRARARRLPRPSRASRARSARRAAGAPSAMPAPGDHHAARSTAAARLPACAKPARRAASPGSPVRPIGIRPLGRERAQPGA